MDLATQKKRILPYLDRAEEIQNIQPKVAYYCRRYALEQAVGLGEKNLDPKVKQLIYQIANNLEKSKTQLKLDLKADAAECEKLAMIVFSKADKNDRMGNYPIARKTFFYASQFFDILKMFDENVSPDVQRLRRYALWRAKVIDDALKAGTLPEPPKDGGNQGLDAASDSELMADLDDLPSVPSGITPAGSTEEYDAEIKKDVRPPAISPPTDSQARNEPKQSNRDAPQTQSAQPVRRFVQFSKVLYCPDGAATSKKEKGTIGEIITGKDGKLLYKVALRSRDVIASAELLAPVVEEGDCFILNSGEKEEVFVEEIYQSQWPPTYLVRREGGGTMFVEGDQLAKGAGKRRTLATSSRPANNKLIATDFSRFNDHKQVKNTMNNTLEDDFDRLSRITEEKSTDLRSESMIDESPKVSTSPTTEKSFEEISQSPVSPNRNHEAAAHGQNTGNYFHAQENYPGIDSTAATKSSRPTPQVRMNPYPGEIPQSYSGFEPPLAAIVEAQKLVKSAGSALSFEDVPTAVKLLSDSLKLLTQG